MEQLRKFASLFDRFFAHLWKYPLKLLCKLTGKNNFYFSRLLLVLSTVLFGINMINQVFVLHHYTALVAIWWVPLWIGEGWKLSRKVEDAVNSSSSPLVTFCMTADEWFKLRIRRLILLVFGRVLIVAEFNYWNIAAILYAGAMCFLCDFQPGNKSWVRQKAEALTETVKRIKLPSLQPIPPPIPS